MPLQIIRQDITKMRVDAIVNTTNEEMVGCSGVDLAIHTLAGEELDKECETLAPLGLGEAKISGAYNLPCKYIIHTSGPVWYGGAYGEVDALRSCYLESLKRAVEYNCKTVAFPLISAGVYRFPKDQVLKFAIQTITEFLFEHELTVYICVYDKESYSFSQKLFQDIQAFIDDEYVAERDEEYYFDYDADDAEEYDVDYDDIYYVSEAPDEYEERDDSEPYFSECARPSRIFASEISEKSTRSEIPQSRSLRDFLNEKDISFREMLFELIDKSGMTDVECYKRANVDKRVFSKIKSNKDYRPSKQTAVAFAISLKLDFNATQELLATAGMTLSKSSTFDKIVLYFIQAGNYDIFEINEALFEFDQKLLGV